MALSAATVWEIRPGVVGASANNGGGFVTGASGTDFSQQNSPQYNAADLASTSGTTNPSVITSASHNFVATDVGNLIHITAGTNWTAGFYQIVSVAANAATLDRAVGTSATLSSGTYAVGGALTSVNNIGANVVVAGNIIYQKNTGNTDTMSASVSSSVAGTATAPIIWEGYNSTRGDLFTATYLASHTTKGFLDTTNMPFVDCGTNTPLSGSVTNWTVRCINFTSSRTTTSVFILGVNINMFRVKGVLTASASTKFASVGLRSLIDDCDFSAVGAASSFILDATMVCNCRMTSTNGGGVTNSAAGALVIRDSLFYDMAASQIAIQQGSANQFTWVAGNTFDNIAGTCVTIPALAQTSPFTFLEDNQVTNCGTFANNLQSGTSTLVLTAERNRIRNTSTSYTGWASNTSNSDITTAQSDVNEYVDRTNKDFHLKDGAAGQGAAWPSYFDTGCYQRKEPTLPGVADVRLSTQYGDSGTEFTGTLNLPAIADVRNGTTYDNATKTGTLVVPIIANVRSGISFGSSSSLTGTLVVPAVGDVRLATAFDTASTGTLRVPSSNDVRNGTAFDTASTGNLVVPVTSDVRSGITFGSSSSLTGVLVLPLANQVQTAVGFGANGTEFTGSFSGGAGGCILGG